MRLPRGRPTSDVTESDLSVRPTDFGAGQRMRALCRSLSRSLSLSLSLSLCVCVCSMPAEGATPLEQKLCRKLEAARSHRDTC
eukprot:COSAG03_NODE_17753_length_368_cov_23.669145_1_plen_82_part_10